MLKRLTKKERKTINRIFELTMEHSAKKMLNFIPAVLRTVSRTRNSLTVSKLLKPEQHTSALFYGEWRRMLCRLTLLIRRCRLLFSGLAAPWCAVLPWKYSDSQFRFLCVFSYWFLTDGIRLKGRKIPAGCLAAPSFPYSLNFATQNT